MDSPKRITWTTYLLYKAKLRGFDLDKLEAILRFSDEHYFDNITKRWITVGRHRKTLVMIPYEIDEEVITPVTIHATTRQQINVRIKSERFRYA